jgi:hypothetical protein
VQTVWGDDEGWYYCTANNAEALIYSDPVFINVQGKYGNYE